MKHLSDLNYGKNRLIKSQLLLLQVIASGITLKEAALMLGVSYNTAKTRLKTLYAKLEVTSRAELISKALKFKLIDTKCVKPAFRKRFLSRMSEQKTKQKPSLLEPLTKEELKFLSLTAHGMKMKEIIETMPLSGIFHTRVLKVSICYKLQAKNITQAVKFAVILEII